MIRTIDKDVTVAANSQDSEIAFTAREGYRTKILKMGWEQVNDAIAELFVDSDKIVECASEIDQVDNEWVPVDYDLGVGQTVKVGFNNESGSSITKHIVVMYEETRG